MGSISNSLLFVYVAIAYIACGIYLRLYYFNPRAIILCYLQPHLKRSHCYPQTFGPNEPILQ